MLRVCKWSQNRAGTASAPHDTHSEIWATRLGNSKVSYGTAWSRGIPGIAMHRTQLSPLGQKLSFLTSVLLRSCCFDVPLGNMSIFLSICLLGFRAIYEILLEYYQALIDSKVMRNYFCLFAWRMVEKEAPDKAIVKGIEGSQGSSCPSEQVWVRGLQIPSFRGCLHDFSVSTYHLHQPTPTLNFFFSPSLPPSFLSSFIERGKGRERKRERNINVWLPLICPLLGTWSANPAWHVPWLGIEPVTLSFAGQCSVHWATTARA